MVAYRQNFYSVPWRYLGHVLPLRITEEELIVYGSDLEVLARHRLLPRSAAGQRSESPQHRPPGGPLGDGKPNRQCARTVSTVTGDRQKPAKISIGKDQRLSQVTLWHPLFRRQKGERGSSEHRPNPFSIRELRKRRARDSLRPFFVSPCHNKALRRSPFGAALYGSLVTAGHYRLLPVVEVANLDKSWTNSLAGFHGRNRAHPHTERRGRPSRSSVMAG